MYLSLYGVLPVVEQFKQFILSNYYKYIIDTQFGSEHFNFKYVYCIGIFLRFQLNPILKLYYQMSGRKIMIKYDGLHIIPLEIKNRQYILFCYVNCQLTVIASP